MLGAVTGRKYIKTRVRGYAPWTPRDEALTLIAQVQSIIAEYSQELTIRQVFYRLVGKYGYEKTEQAYNRLGEYLNRARRAGVLEWDAFRDDGDIVPEIPGWLSPAQFWATIQSFAENYFRTPDGEHYVEVWVETAGMQPQIQTVADPFGVRAVASGGFSSVTARRNAARRLIIIEKPVTVLLIGDFDPSGQSIMDSTCEDVRAFGAEVNFSRLAVTPDQAAKYKLESAPQKDTDKRGEYMAQTYQAEALDPDVLADIVRARLVELIGADNVAESQRLTKLERVEILSSLKKLVRKF
jgi:hypothetical protein